MDPIGEFAEKIMGWTNIVEVQTEAGIPKVYGDLKAGQEEYKQAEVPNYYEDGIAMWASGNYIKQKCTSFEFVQALSELTGAADLNDSEEIFKLIFADPRLKVRAAIVAFDRNNDAKIN